MAPLTAHPALSLSALSGLFFLLAWACLAVTPIPGAMTPAADQVLLFLSLVLACGLFAASVIAASGESA